MDNRDHVGVGNAATDTTPEYQPGLPVPIPSGHVIELQLGTEDVLGKKRICGFVILSGLQNLKVGLTWKDLEPPGVLKGCSVFRKSDKDIAKLIQDMANKMIGASKQNMGIEVECDKGYECCNKAQFDGTYPVTAVLKAIQLNNVWGKPICELSGSISGTATVQGEVGGCVKQ